MLGRPERLTGATAVAVISGTAGVGKSALALQTAHTLTERFSSGQLYVNLRGATPGMTPLTPAQALTALLRDLGTRPCAIPEHPDTAAALLRSLLAPTRTLLPAFRAIQGFWSTCQAEGAGQRVGGW